MSPRTPASRAALRSSVRASRYAASRCPPLGGDPHPLLGVVAAPVLQQIGQRVRPQGVPLLGGLPQPVLGGRLVAPLPVVPPERVRGGGAAGDGGDPPPAGGLVGVSPLVQQHTQVVRGGAVARGGRGAQMGFGSVEIAAAQQHGPEDAHRLDLTGLGGEPLTCLLGRLARLVLGLLLTGRLHKSPCLEQSCLVPP
ncbi:hypothetical protein GCM10020295_27100 [Streptomyces cinereospinus]